MSVLFPHVAFDHVETPLSFATRLANFHLRSTVVPFLHDLGIKPEALLGNEEPAIDRLAAVADVDASALRHNAARRTGKRQFSLRSHDVSAEFFSSPNTVFCPACILEDDTEADDVGSVRRGRLEWTIRSVRTCARHRLALTRRRPQKWDDKFHELAHRVPERGDDLRRLIDETRQQDPSPLQNYIVARLDGRPGPAWLDGHDIEQAVRVTEMLGMLIAFGPERKPADLVFGEQDTVGRIGFEITAGGDVAIRDALFDVQKHALRNGGRAGRRKVFGPFYEWLSSSRTRKDPGDIRRILREHIFETMEVAPGEAILGGELTERRLHSVESLAKETGLDPRTLRNVLAAEGLIPDLTGENHHVFDAAAGRKVARSVTRKTHVSSLGKALNCTRPQAVQLLDERLLIPIVEGPRTCVGRTRKAVDNREIARFLSDLQSDAKSVHVAPTGMVAISKAAEKAKCPSSDVVHLILGGFLSNVVKLRDVEGYAGILVDPEEVRAQIATTMVGLSASAAFGRMQLPKSTGWALALSANAPRIEPTVIEGKNGRHDIFRFSEQAIADFMAKFTTPTRIANQFDLQIGVVINRLKRSRIRPVLARRHVGIDIYRFNEIPEMEAA